ncbi:Cna B-type domain-containing protein, partial [Blautia luti]
MNKKNKAKRYLAGLLTVLMIFQQSGMNSILADSDEIPVTFAAEEELAGYDEVQEYEGQAQVEETVEEPVTEEVMEEEPIQPEETEEPEEPSQPEESGEPEEPSQPEEPGEPEDPSQPEESGDPEETMQPEEPGDSEEPEQPEITEIPKLTATPEPEQTEVPKTDFSYEDESISVTAAAEESAGLPQDAQLKVENLLNTDPQRYEGEKSEMNSLLGIDGEIFTAEYLLYDIYFWSETAGGRVEPADGSVKVQMNFTEPQLVKNTQEQIVRSNLKVYVNRQEDTAAQFDTNEAEAVQGAAFSAVNMGTAAIVRINEMKKNEQLVYTYEDSEVVVTATLAAPDAVPDEAEFRVTRVTPQTAGYNYDVYMQALNNNAEMISPDNSANGQESDVYTEKNTLLYDIAFLVDKTDENGNVIPGEKEEYQPTEGAVNISFDFKKSQLTQEVEAEKAEEIAVVHLPLDEATKESVDTTADATDISAGNINVEVVSEAEVQLETEAADFDLNNFSLVAFVNVNGQELNPGTLQNYWSILGNAIYYGVTANTINKDAHMDTNFATKYFTGSGNVTAGAYTGNNGDANNGGVYVIADMSSDSSLKIDGKNSDVWCTDAIKDRLSLEVNGKGQKTIFAKGALEVYVDRLIASVSKVSASMADEVSYQVKNQNEVMNQAEIDISERPEGTYYIDGDWLNDISEGALRIKKKSDQTIVFNYKGTSVNLKRFEIWDTDRESGYMQSTTSSASADQYARTVVFNMPNATDVTFASGMFGIFLAPKATVHGLGGTSSGWLVVDTLDKNGSEWHCVWSDMPDSSHIPVPAQLTAIKTVNGDRPGDDEKFRFKLEIYNKEWRKWAQVEILPNKGNFVTFTSMTFRADGQYYYRISEYGEVDGYIKDDTVYIAVITVSSDSQISGDTTITSYKIDSVKYYRASDLEEVTEDNLVPAAAFDNTRQEEEKIETSVCKEWDDADNQDGKRPQSILVQLYANGQKLGEPVVLNEGNGWSYGWSDLPVKQDGQTVVYSVKEVGRIPGYESTVTGDVQTGFVITNSHTPELTNISGEKIWDDGDNQDGKRPESITVNLFANGEKIDSKAVKADAEGNWKYSFKNLPKYADGQLISYTVTEDAVPEYTTEISGTTIINKYQPGKTSISVIKAWEDGNNQDGLRPTDIKVQLYADGSKQGEEITLNAGNQWSYTWSDLDEMKSGQKIVYTVKEVGKIAGYDTVISGEAKTGYVITNSHTPELTKISGEKIWDDGDNQDGKRPESITVNLFANGEKIDSKAVKADAEGNWKYSFKNLPKYADGQLISYTVTEDVVPEYTTEISGTTIINKYQPGKTSISVIKAWEDGNNQDGLRPTDIKVQL